jgi:hypothetical protein
MLRAFCVLILVKPNGFPVRRAMRFTATRKLAL